MKIMVRMDPLDQIAVQLEAASARAQRIVGSLSPALLGRRPDPNSWSVAECIAHLSLTTDAYLPAIRQALEEGRRRGLRRSGNSFRVELSARMLAWWLEPPYRMKARTPAAFVPGVEDPEAVLADFLERQRRLLEVLVEGSGLPLDRLPIRSPFAHWMHYGVYAAFVVIAAHERRHLWQAEQTAQKVEAH
jgi:hypothetical protein